MELLSFDPEQIKVFFLILIRIGTVLFMLPIFGGNMLPAPVKAGFAMLLSIVFFPVIAVDPGLFPTQSPNGSKQEDGNPRRPRRPILSTSSRKRTI